MNKTRIHNRISVYNHLKNVYVQRKNQKAIYYEHMADCLKTHQDDPDSTDQIEADCRETFQTYDPKQKKWKTD